MPVLSLPEDLRQQLEQSATGVIDNSNCPGVAVYLTSHGRAHARADIYVGLELDGFDHYQNINADRPDIKMKFALMPGISCQSEVVTLYPNDKDVLSIQVGWLFHIGRCSQWHRRVNNTGRYNT